MSQSAFPGKFLDEAKVLISEHMSNELFGVSELAALMHMSRSSLLRKIKKETGVSASQFIRNLRLEKAKELLKETELGVSEISYEVGFGNNSYFIKCFKARYGFPPGEARKQFLEQEIMETPEITAIQAKNFLKRYKLPFAAMAVIAAVVAVILLLKKPAQNSIQAQPDFKNAIAVLPFKNMSNDSTNLYFVNGLMESALGNLQKIKDLRVISRTSVEKYRHTNKTIAEIAKELHVNYVVEGSGQRDGNQVLLHIQLIDASNDTPIWAEQYNHKIVDIFSLQNAVAKKIADAIEAKVTPAELEQIEKKPTDNLKAYDFYLQALIPFQEETKAGLEKAIPLFKKAIENDPKFALAYSKLAIAYYFLDIYQNEKRYTEIINNYADKALLYDPKSAESLISKALYYMQIQDYRLAIPHLEKALEYNPNSSAVIQILSDLYARVIPDTREYLKYALKGLQLDIEANDSVEKSFIYLHLSNAFIQNGFTTQASEYIDKSLEYNPENYYAPYLKVFIQYAQNQNLDQTRKALITEWKKDTTRLDIMQEIGKFYYFQEDYDSAYYYYHKFISVKTAQNLNIYPQENLKIGIVYDALGFHEEAKDFYQAYASYCKNDISIYKPASLAMWYLHENKSKLALESLRSFSNNQNYQYWILLFLEKDPLMKKIKGDPGYNAVMQRIKERFWDNHDALEKTLKEKGLI
ncbi:helix-turn-helix domain-containing protein [Gaetbulibacter aestuarii]|uniref:Helix-turn-helix domain-containing protein n=1 Tax=Gaetbulibacter aestuarii TaxID=1502358 RepID=A0ABW7MW86_9FLAO